MSSEITIGFADSDPNNSAPSRLTDTNPIVGNIVNVTAGNRIEILDGLALGKIFFITFVDIPNDEYKVGENLFAEGVRSGDQYRTIDTFFSEYDEVPTINRERLEPSQPDASLLWKNIQQRTRAIEDTIRGKKIVEGAIDSVSTTDLTDANPTTGVIINLQEGQVVEVTVVGVDAEAKRARIDSVTATVITFFENIQNLGFASGDSYRVIHGRKSGDIGGHDHDGVNSIEFDRHDVVPWAGMLPC